MEIKELYPLIRSFDRLLKYYVCSQQEVTATYYIANNFLSELAQKSNKIKEIRNEYGEWLKHDGSIRLIKLLSYTNYNDSNILHFNAMALIDTVHSLRYVMQVDKNDIEKMKTQLLAIVPTLKKSV